MYDFFIRHAEYPTLFGDGAMDVIIDNGGRAELIENSPKLQMELLKTCLTERVTIGDKKYGSTIPKLIGQKQYHADDSFTQAIVAASAEKTVIDYKNQQAANVPEEEKIYRLDKPARAVRDTKDPTIVVVEVVVETESGNSVEVMHQLATS